MHRGIQTRLPQNQTNQRQSKRTILIMEQYNFDMGNFEGDWKRWPSSAGVYPARSSRAGAVGQYWNCSRRTARASDPYTGHVTIHMGSNANWRATGANYQVLQEALQHASAATCLDSPVDVHGAPFLDPVDDSPAPSYSYAVGLLSAQIDIALFDLENIRSN